MSSSCAAPEPDAAWRILTTLLVGLAAGGLFTLLHSPLPWMLGPLLVTATLNVGFDRRLGLPMPLRSAGQWAIGTAVGLYFSLEVLRELLHLWPWLLIAILFSLAISAAGGALLSRLSGIDRATGFFSVAIGGAVEMTNQAERSGARVDRVAAAQSLRVVIVVVGLPYVFFMSGAHGTDPYAAAVRSVDASKLLLMLAATVPSGLLLQALRVPNAWTLGPLAAIAAMTVAGVPLSALPPVVVGAGQLLLGCALGGRFSPDFLRAAPRFMACVSVTSLLIVAVCALFAGLVATATGASWPTMILATAPGGIAEMSLTAKLLHLGVPVVAAFQLVRLIALVLLAGPAYRGWTRMSR
ncbi:AbrB family transcriptional regulator [Hydrocarboniphaga effusa]|jgi:membrane AbrB-like protein|uniref:AbrB family transcriptional regulator n=1 Tax=Hydrocarboniphaga effusa TaxID=243629 RepID=UPI003137E17F